MLRRTFALTLLAAAAAAAPAATAQVQERSSAPTCTDGSACSSSSLSFSAMHKPGGAHAPASSLEVMSWSWGVSNNVHSPSGLASGKRQHKPPIRAGSSMASACSGDACASGKASYSDITMTKSPSAAVSSVGSLSGSSGGAAAASYARLSPPACSSSSGACPGTVSVQLAASRKGWDGCVKGSHIPSAQLRGASSDVHLGDVTIEDCDDVSGRMTLRYASVREVPGKPPAR